MAQDNPVSALAEGISSTLGSMFWFVSLLMAGAWLGLSYRAGSWADGRETSVFLLGSILLAPFSPQRLLGWGISVGMWFLGGKSELAVGRVGGGFGVLMTWAGMAAWGWRVPW